MANSTATNNGIGGIANASATASGGSAADQAEPIPNGAGGSAGSATATATATATNGGIANAIANATGGHSGKGSEAGNGGVAEQHRQLMRLAQRQFCDRKRYRGGDARWRPVRGRQSPQFECRSATEVTGETADWPRMWQMAVRPMQLRQTGGSWDATAGLGNVFAGSAAPGGAATANASATNGGPAIATATGGNGGSSAFLSGGNGGSAGATATSTAMQGGTANATATATGGNGGASPALPDPCGHCWCRKRQFIRYDDKRQCGTGAVHCLRLKRAGTGNRTDQFR